jgi:hypothetical protein
VNETKRALLANGAVIVLLSLLIFLAGTWWRLETQYALGVGAMERGDYAGAVAGFESAIHMYIPLHPTVERAAERLWQVAETSERSGDVKRALIAYRALRSSFYATRWLITPGTGWIERCDRKIAQLLPFLKDQ